jgi:hypothetical protein
LYMLIKRIRVKTKFRPRFQRRKAKLTSSYQDLDAGTLTGFGLGRL